MNESVAPDPLLRVQEFVNSYELDTGRDELTDEGLRAWMLRHSLAGGDEGIADSDVGRAMAVREALRGLLAVNNGAPPRQADLDVLNAAAAACPLEVRFDPDGAELTPRSRGLDAALGRLLLGAFEAMADGSWDRLKVCADDTCRWAFLDQSRNRSGHWCAMRSCGNRAKARRFRARRGTATNPAAGD
ncbi:MAG: CGNR zinc finger domain-containing protein [Candidatus Dormibacteraeota bacterium]|nr:CGNR zinc finger domain-containing protein [Candidatus Dormibacteraeota bacterium]